MHETRSDRFLRRPEVERITGLRTTAIYKLIAEGLFPKSRRYIGARGVFWLEHEVVAWQEAQLEVE
jgi:prophage regulatory protein